MNNKIQVLREMVEAKRPVVLSESIKIFKSKPLENTKITNDKTGRAEIKGPGYWLYISSDSPEGNEFKDEALHMSSILNLSKSKKFAFMKENPGVGRLKQYKDPTTNQFGWGYYIEDSLTQRDPTLASKRLDWLKGLVRKYNTTKELQDDVETGKMTIDQVNQIQDLVSDIEEASVMNPETKAKLEKYLDELTVAVENDEVFEFLANKYSEAKTFINNNMRAGTNNNYPYTVTNTFIIRAADPGAVLAAQEKFWKGRGYRVKPGVKGISIRRPKAGSTEQTAKRLQSNPEAWAAYKQKHGFDPNAGFKDVMKANPDLHSVDMAHQAIYNKAVRTQFTREETNYFGLVYTDTMVEPIPGENVISIKDMIDTGGGEPEIDPFHVPQKELDSETHRQKLNVLFRAVVDIAEEDQINTQGMSFNDGDINEFNKFINAISFNKAVKKLPSMMGIKGNISPEVEEMIHGYAEVISNLIKRNYGLPSEESKYNIARQGIDREEMQKMYSEIIRIADSIVKRIDKLVNSEQPTLNEIRKIVRSVLRNI